jgi:hypothetical protein
MSEERKNTGRKFKQNFELSENNLNLELLYLKNRSYSMKIDKIINSPHLHPKPNNISVSPIKNHFDLNKEKSNISMKQSLLLSKNPSSFSCPNSDEDEKENIHLDSSYEENEFKLNFDSDDENENKKEKEDIKNNKIKELKQYFHGKKIYNKINKEYENILKPENNIFNIIFDKNETKKNSIFRKHIQKEFSLTDSGINNLNLRHTLNHSNLSYNSILRVLVSTVEEKKLRNSIKASKIRMSAKI